MAQPRQGASVGLILGILCYPQSILGRLNTGGWGTFSLDSRELPGLSTGCWFLPASHRLSRGLVPANLPAGLMSLSLVRSLSLSLSLSLVGLPAML